MVRIPCVRPISMLRASDALCLSERADIVIEHQWYSPIVSWHDYTASPIAFITLNSDHGPPFFPGI